MSDIFGTPRPRPTNPRPARRRRVLVPTLITLAVLLILGSVFTSVWTDRLWFRSVGYGNVFGRILTARVGLFLVFGLVFGLFVSVNLWLGYRFRPSALTMRRDDPAARYREALTPILRPALIAIAVVLTGFAGAVGAGRWKTFELWLHGTSFGTKDPQFHKDVGFYMFTYPWLRFLASYGFTLAVVTIIGVAFLNYVYGGLSIGSRGPKFSRAAQVHLSVLIGLAVLVRAFSYWLDRFGAVIHGTGWADGAGYTDVHARIPSRNILIAVAIVCALLFFSSIFQRSWLLPGIGLGLLVLTSVLIAGIWPYVMQSFQVKPSQPDKEGPYIQRNITATRAAYDLSDVKATPYSAKTALTSTELAQTAESRVSSRLLDPTLVSPAFQQLQQVRGYYSVPDTLDVDRYTIGSSKEPQDVVIAARELDLNGLKASQRNWANDHTVYTHGYGVIAAYGNKSGANGEPVWVEKDIPPTGDLKLTEKPRIYFGEDSPSYSIVGQPKGKAPIEVDTPRGDNTSTATTKAEATAANATQNTYDGTGGVPIGSTFHKLLYAFKFGEPNIVLSSRVNSASKILYDRTPRDRVEKVAPWLTVDGDPYPAVVNGRVVWIVDAYTTSNNYPYSQHRSLESATSDSLTGNGKNQAALPSDEINYMRNSVKAVVDAYDGTVKLYQWDTTDPVLKTWMKIFPGVVKPKADISQGLLEHLRYPQDLFKVQRDVLTTYHVTDPQTFYEGGEAWKVPEDPNDGAKSSQPPYYVSVSRPGQTTPEFALTSVYAPNSRQNLASFISVGSEATDAKTYGKIQILQLPTDTQVPGPSQIANQFSTDTGVTSALLPYKQSGTDISYGNLLTLPVGSGLLYVEPVYITRRATQGSYPVLQFVIASFGSKIGHGQTLDEALRNALGLTDSDESTSGTSSGSSSGTSSGSSGSTTTPKTAAQYIAKASDEYDAAQAALKAGNLASYQSHIKAMGTAIAAAQKALGTK